ncbi:uncharacterized protein [Temnothorax longispinosus]|uniref:uncharacterized protein isoform X1 n=1 Tax=Temnothorax longispinosus TaxID=300112 RepID=UPI003A99DE01
MATSLNRMCLDVYRKMISVETKYFDLNRILLLAIGLWPYKQSKLVRFQLILFFGILMSCIIFQLTTFLTAEYTLGLAIKIFSYILLLISFIIKYNSFWINIQTVRYLLEQLQHIYIDLKDENEIAIVEKYGCNAKHYTIRIIQITLCSAFAIISVPMWPRILDIVMPMNESRPRITMPIPTEYFVDQEKYFYLILLHLNVATCIGATAYIATGTMLITYLKHACGMFKIASYRIERAMMINILQNSMENEIMIYKAMIYAVDIHRKAIKFAEFLITNFEGSFLFLIAVSVCCLSLNLFRIFQSVTFGNRKEELLLHFLIVAIILLYMFLANYAGQEITDHNNHVFSTAYNVRWYTAPLSIQKLILFLLQRGSKTFSLNVGGLFAASLKCFASLTSASISYFTVIYSTQQ